jgi:hypothetical protein
MTKKLSDQLQDLQKMVIELHREQVERIDKLDGLVDEAHAYLFGERDCEYSPNQNDYTDLDDILVDEINIYDKGRRTKEELFERWKELDAKYRQTFSYFHFPMKEEEEKELEAIEEELGYSLIVYKDLKKYIERRIENKFKDIEEIEQRCRSYMSWLIFGMGFTLTLLFSFGVAYFLS